MVSRTRGYAHRTDIVASAQAVWSAMTDSEALKKWCSPDASIRAKTGGLFRASVDRVTHLEAHIDICDPARRLRLIYLPCDALPGEDAVTDDFILASMPRGTMVRLLGAGFTAADGGELQFRRMRMGWERALARLKVYVEQLEKKGTP